MQCKRSVSPTDGSRQFPRWHAKRHKSFKERLCFYQFARNDTQDRGSRSPTRHGVRCDRGAVLHLPHARSVTQAPAGALPLRPTLPQGMPVKVMAWGCVRALPSLRAPAPCPVSYMTRIYLVPVVCTTLHALGKEQETGEGCSSVFKSALLLLCTVRMRLSHAHTCTLPYAMLVNSGGSCNALGRWKKHTAGEYTSCHISSYHRRCDTTCKLAVSGPSQCAIPTLV